MSKTSRWAPRSSRLALVAGFGGLLAIIALSGWDALRILNGLRQESDQIRSQFLSRNRLLNNIRSSLYLSGTYVRDYLLDPDPSRAAGFATNLAQVRHQMETDLSSYARQVSGGTSQYGALRADLDEYWRLLDPALKWSVHERQMHGYTFLRDEVFPRRAAILEIASRIEEIDEQQVAKGNERADDMLDKFETRLTLTLIAALALGLGMTAISVRKILHLESDVQSHYREAEEARLDLTELSAKLVEAQEAERRSLSRELHDEIGQALSAALFELRNLSGGVGSWTNDRVQMQIDMIRSQIEGTVRIARNMALLLRPSMLDDLGLIPALRWQADEVSKRTGIAVHLETTLVSDDLPDQYKTCIYRVVQEALHNTSRHAQAASAWIRVEQTPVKLRLTVRDDGRGFDVQKSKGMGLVGIEERAAQLDGTASVHSQFGIGTILSLELPFADRFVPKPQKERSETHPHPVG